MATYNAVMRPVQEYASFIWWPLASLTSINKLQPMQNAALRTATRCIQGTHIQHMHDETSLTTGTTQQTCLHTPNSHYNRHKNKHAPYTYIYCLQASSHNRQ